MEAAAASKDPMTIAEIEFANQESTTLRRKAFARASPSDTAILELPGRIIEGADPKNDK
jgi:hypothetical protein